MIACFALTSALSAFLLFLIQPLIAKPLLPLLGGSPSVWNTCMMMFQFLLLLGYSYAYAGSRALAPRPQSMLHIALLGGSLLLLPFGLQEAGFDPVEQPQLWLIVTLLQSIGIPYTLLAASAPMLQRWIASTDHPMASNPYPLYSASNAGSFLALLAYPVYVEPTFSTTAQFAFFSQGYVLLAAGFMACVILLTKNLAVSGNNGAVSPQTQAPQDARQIAAWVFFAFVPASLLYGVTTYLISDIASVPLLWLIPLMLYLLSFVLAFSERPISLAAYGRPFVLLCVFATLPLFTMASLFTKIGVPQILMSAIILASVFLGFVYFHRVLYLRRPAPDRLAFYYVIVSLGGVLGGVFNALLSPVLFNTALEFPLILCVAGVACVLLDTQGRFRAEISLRPGRRLLGLLGIPFLFYLSLLALPLERLGAMDGMTVKGILLAIMIFLFLLLTDGLFANKRHRFLSLAFFGFLMFAIVSEKENALFTYRNFFGISRVTYDEKNKAHIYVHGVTVHGMQSLEEGKRLNPVSYYVPLRQVFEHVPAAKEADSAVLGLGVGTIACYAQHGQVMDFFEIDPAPILVAKNEALFTYLKDCPGQYDIIVGDGRLEIQKAEDARYGIIVMDAFTSDAIPVHLITREALELYAKKLKPEGVIAFNISNRFLNLMPVLASLAQDLGWSGAYRAYLANKPLEASSIWVALFPDPQQGSHFLEAASGWKALTPSDDPRYRWTDRYSSLLSVLIFDQSESPLSHAATEDESKASNAND